MALTAEQQAQVEIQEATEAGRRAHEQQMEVIRQTNAIEIAKVQKEAQLATILANAQSNSDYQGKQIRLEAIRLAKEILIENARSKPVDSRDVTADDIKTFAQTFVSFING